MRRNNVGEEFSHITAPENETSIQKEQAFPKKEVSHEEDVRLLDLVAYSPTAQELEQVQSPPSWPMSEILFPLIQQHYATRVEEILLRHGATFCTTAQGIRVQLPEGTRARGTHKRIGLLQRSVLYFPDGYEIDLEEIPGRQHMYNPGFPPEDLNGLITDQQKRRKDGRR